MIESIILCTIFGVFILLAYTLGLKNGQKLKNNEPIEMPKIIEPIKENITSNKSNYEDFLTKEQQISWENINNFDGTRESQQVL